MRLLIWSQYFWPENFIINKIATTLVTKGIEVTVITGKPNYPGGKIFQGYRATHIDVDEYQGVNIVRLPIFPRGKGTSWELLLNYVSFICSGYLFAPYILRAKQFDIILVFAPSPLLQALPAVLISWLKHIPLCTWIQDIWPESLSATGHIKNRFLLYLVKQLVRFIYGNSDCLLIQSELFRPSIKRLMDVNCNVKYFPNPSDDLLKFSSELLSENKLAHDISCHFSIVFAGNIGVAQSCKTILDAAKLLLKYPEIKFYIIGDGSQFSILQEALKNGEIPNVVLTGWISPENMPVIFSAASALLISLKNDPVLSITIPSKLQSYMSAGKPIIASLNGMVVKLISDSGAGLCSPAESSSALAETVIKLFEMTVEERIGFGENSRKYYEKNFQLNHRVDELFELLGAICERNKD